MNEVRISPGVRDAWQIAGDFVLESGGGEIELLHLLYGVCALETQTLSLASGRHAVGSRDASDLREEIGGLRALFRSAGVDSADVIGTIQAAYAGTSGLSSKRSAEKRHVPRSSATRALFQSGVGQSNPVLDLSHLAIAVFTAGDPRVLEMFGREVAAIAAFAPQFQDAPSSDPSDGLARGIAALESTGAAIDTGAEITVLETIDAGSRIAARGATERFTALCELAWESGTEEPLELMLQKVLAELLRLVPAAERGVILVRDRATGGWMLKAHSSPGTPRLSMTSVRQASEQKKGFHWRRGEDLSRSQKEENLEAGIYAPMLANDEVFGIICLDSSREDPPFTAGDLQLVTAMAHQLGLAIANRELRRDVTLSAKLMERLLTNFSPQVRTRLLQRARQGRLQLGGERATVTILCSDIRGFTRLAARMEADEVAEMLNDYFSALMRPIFQNDGTIDKFIGDAVLVVFGSPEADPDQSRKALLTAVEMQNAAHRVSQERAAEGRVSCEIGIGIHCGEVIHGFIGSPERMEYTVIGDAVNLAARYCDGARAGEILISEEMLQRVWEHAEATKTTITTKHQGELTAYQVKRLRTTFESK
jgi:adenylate cyclase